MTHLRVPALPIIVCLMFLWPAGRGPNRVSASNAGSQVPASSSQRQVSDTSLNGERAVSQGISVEFSLRRLAQRLVESHVLLENEDVEWRFRITDTATGTPLRGGHPAAWLDPADKDAPSDPNACSNKVAAYLNAGLLGPHPIDLNSYFVISLNQDSTITVVDPRFGYGGTKLLAMILLDSPGEDWALTYDQNRLFVSEPDSNQVAAADTGSWKVTSNIATGPHPTRIALQPDEHYLWVAYGDPVKHSVDSGVSVVVTTTTQEVARIQTGRGRHEIAFSDDSLYAFVTNQDEGTVSVIDVRTLKKISDLKVGLGPGSIAYSSAAKTAYVTNEGDGTIAAVRADSAEVRRIQSEPGLGQIRFTPGGRFGIVVNPARGKACVLDASNDRIIQTAAIDGAPDQITFSSTLAYIRRGKSETVFMIPLAKLGEEGRAIAAADFPGGQHPLGSASRPSPADSIVQVPNENAVLVANPADKSIYYYMEGMAAPMGNFSNYGREPRAVLIVDRSLRESQPGVYSAVARLRGPGTYDVAFVLDSPRVVHCFQVQVDADPTLATGSKRRSVTITPLPGDLVIKAGKAVTLRFRINDSKTGEAIQGLDDIQALALLAPGIWQHRQPARNEGGGVYSIELVPPRPGIYYIYLASRALGLPFGNGQYMALEAKEEAGVPGRQ